MNRKVYPTKEEIFELFDEKTILNKCKFVWKKSRGGRKAGSVAGCFDPSTGYWRIQINGENYARHRLMWIAHFGKIAEGCIVDHIDDHLDGLNDHISNLQLITQRDNITKSTMKDESNVYKVGSKWKVQFGISGQKCVFGTFYSKEKAIEEANRVRNLLRQKEIL